MSKKLNSGAKKWDFEKSPLFIGSYVGPVKREKDAAASRDGGALKDNEKAGATIYHEFADATGETHLIGNSYAVNKAAASLVAGSIVKIEFKGKTLNATKQPVNSFDIELFDETDTEYKAFLDQVKNHADAMEDTAPAENTGDDGVK